MTTADPVDEAAAVLATVIARRSTAWWRTATPSGRTRADAVLALVHEVVRLTQRLTGEDHGLPRRPPREDVLVDQLAVVTYDLVEALDATRDSAAAEQATAAYAATRAEVG